MNEAIMRRPKFDLKFITETSEFHIVSNAETPNNQFMTESIISMSTKNSMEDDSSVFSFVIAGDMEWDKILSENDLVVLKIQPNEATPGSPGTQDNVRNNTVAVGLVSEVRLEGTYVDDSKMYRVTGQSIAKAFMQFELRAIQNITFPNPMMGWMDGGSNFKEFTLDLAGNNVAQLVNKMMDRFLDMMKYNFSKTTKNSELQSRIVRSISSWEEDESLLNPVSFTNFEGSFNQLLNEIVQKPFCEMFFDVYSDEENNEKAVFVVRRTPFDKEDWNALPEFQLGTRDVMSEQLARTDLDAYSIFNVKPDSYTESEYPVYEITPQFHPSLVDKYGYKMLEVTHKYLTPLGAGGAGGGTDVPTTGNLPMEEENTTATGSVTSLIRKYSKKLYDWYVMNPNFYSGEIKVVGHPDYRMGNKLRYSDKYSNDVWVFYIESVEHDFSYSGGYTTTLGVTRGLRVTDSKPDGGRFTPPTGAPQDFKGGYLGELSLDELKKTQELNKKANSGVGSSGQSGANHGLVEGSPSEQAKKATDFALQFVNNGMGATAYHWGGGRQLTNPLTESAPYLLDCSSFVYWAYKHAGVQLGGSDTGMTTWTIGGKEGAVWTVGGIGSGLKANNLTYGDLVFFNNDQHIGIYVGGGEFVGWNGSGYNNFAKGCERKSMATGYWAGKFEGHVMRHQMKGGI